MNDELMSEAEIAFFEADIAGIIELGKDLVRWPGDKPLMVTVSAESLSRYIATFRDSRE